MITRLSRRDFLTGSGALVVSFSIAPLLEPLASGQGRFDTHISHIDPARLDSWLAVGADGIVTAYTGKCDFGQGMYTAQTQLVAEELCVSIERVQLIQCDTSVTPDQGTTSGSQSTPTNFNNSGLAQASATAREALIKMAAPRLAVPASQLTVADGKVIEHRNLCHAYASTARSVQGSTAARVITRFDRNSVRAATKDIPYVLNSRGREDCQIYVESIADPIDGHGPSSDIGADFVARQRREIHRRGRAESRARIS